MVPFLLGCAGSVVLYQHMQQRMDEQRAQGHEVKDVPFASFLLFTGLSMSITAFPVLGAWAWVDMGAVCTCGHPNRV